MYEFIVTSLQVKDRSRHNIYNTEDFSFRHDLQCSKSHSEERQGKHFAWNRARGSSISITDGTLTRQRAFLIQRTELSKVKQFPNHENRLKFENRAKIPMKQQEH